MSNTVKIALYVGLTCAAAFFGFSFYSNYSLLMSDAPDSSTALDTDVPALKRVDDPGASQGYARVVAYGGLFVVMIVGLGLLVAHDVSHYFGSRAINLLYNEEAEPMGDPEYELAEAEWANGNYLEAIRLMREYLKKKPREQHVAIRIAEVYEKDLHNLLAAALEYEAVLTHKLMPEKWGWTAIHLCNLYFKLNQPAKAIELLRRIDAEYGETAAAEKARKRLEQIEGAPSQEAALEETPPAAAEAPERPEAAAPEEPAKNSPQLPPGFSLKKR